MLFTATLTIATLSLLSVLTTRTQPGWSARGIRTLGRYRYTAAAQTLTGLTLAALTYPTWGSAPAAAAAAAGWIGVLAVSTDLASRKIPWDTPHYATGVGLVVFAVTGLAGHWTVHAGLSLATATIALVLLPFLARALTRAGLGMSDIRLLGAYTATLSWWAGPIVLMYALIAACGLQLGVRILARPLGWGTWVAHPAADPEAAAAPRRLELPFAPALVVAYTAALVYTALTGVGSCQVWVATGAC